MCDSTRSKHAVLETFTFTTFRQLTHLQRQSLIALSGYYVGKHGRGIWRLDGRPDCFFLGVFCINIYHTISHHLVSYHTKHLHASD